MNVHRMKLVLLQQSVKISLKCVLLLSIKNECNAFRINIIKKVTKKETHYSLMLTIVLILSVSS